MFVYDEVLVTLACNGLLQCTVYKDVCVTVLIIQTQLLNGVTTLYNIDISRALASHAASRDVQHGLNWR